MAVEAPPYARYPLLLLTRTITLIDRTKAPRIDAHGVVGYSRECIPSYASIWWALVRSIGVIVRVRRRSGYLGYGTLPRPILLQPRVQKWKFAKMEI